MTQNIVPENIAQGTATSSERKVLEQRQQQPNAKSGQDAARAIHTRSRKPSLAKLYALRSHQPCIHPRASYTWIVRTVYEFVVDRSNFVIIKAHAYELLNRQQGKLFC